jgi:PAS domain S-box-containing protein
VQSWCGTHYYAITGSPEPGDAAGAGAVDDPTLQAGDRNGPELTATRGSGQALGPLFSAAFLQSANPMTLVDVQRRVIDVNGALVRALGYKRREIVGQPLYRFVVGGPRLSDAQWREVLSAGRYVGEAELIRGDGSSVAVQYAATGEVVTGRSLVLAVIFSSSRWGAHFRRPADGAERRRFPLSRRELEVTDLVARGKTGPEIADELQIAHDTVRTHVRNAMEKLDARSRAHLVAKALGEGHVLGV